MFSSSIASDADKYPISLEFKLSLSESIAVSFVIQHCVVFSKNEYTTFKIFKITFNQKFALNAYLFCKRKRSLVRDIFFSVRT